MAKAEYYIPRTGITWTVEDAKDEVDLIAQVKDIEGIKRIPQSWKLRIQKNGIMVEVNRSAATRMKVEQLRKERKAAKC